MFWKDRLCFGDLCLTLGTSNMTFLIFVSSVVNGAYNVSSIHLPFGLETMDYHPLHNVWHIKVKDGIIISNSNSSISLKLDVDCKRFVTCGNKRSRNYTLRQSSFTLLLSGLKHDNLF